MLARKCHFLVWFFIVRSVWVEVPVRKVATTSEVDTALAREAEPQIDRPGPAIHDGNLASAN